jgi:hypothetical protein
MSLPINSRPLMVLRLATSTTHDIGSTPQGTLTIFPVTGGSFESERLRGQVLAGGGGRITAHSDGTFTLDLRVTLETDDGDLIHTTFTGVRDDANDYFRTAPRFETAAPKDAFLNRLLAVGRSTLARPDTRSLRRPSPASAGFTAIPTTSLSSTDRPVEIG